VTVTGAALLAEEMLTGAGTVQVSPAGAPVQEKAIVPE
jgi:hypothetical protein